MTKRIIITMAALVAAIAVPAAVIAAANAYTSPALKVKYAGSTTVIDASAAVSDDPTARAAFYTPTGTVTTTGQTPGSVIGTVKAQVSALDLGGALLPLTGNILVAPPGAVDPAIQTLCTQGQIPTATWLLVLQAAGQTLNLPAYLLPTVGAETAIGPSKLVFCLPPPDVPVGTPGRATFGAKFLSAEMSVVGVFGSVQTGAWISFWTPYTPLTGAINAAATVAAPAAIAPGAVTARARKSGKVSTVVSGLVTQAGQARGAAAVAIWAGKGTGALKRLKTVQARANGAFSTTVKSAVLVRFQARAVASGTAAPPLCALMTPLLGGVPCVNPTVNGFAAQSPVVRRK